MKKNISSQLLQSLEWFQNEVKKDIIETEQHKKKLIEEFRQLNKEEMVQQITDQTKAKKKLSFKEKIKKLFGGQ